MSCDSHVNLSLHHVTHIGVGDSKGGGSGVLLEKKMSELQGNCDLLVSQITSIRSLTSDLAETDSAVSRIIIVAMETSHTLYL